MALILNNKRISVEPQPRQYSSTKVKQIMKYQAERMVATSRCQNYFPTLPSDIRKDIYKRIGELIEEEKQYCDKGNYKHMAQILSSIAMYEVFQQHGKTEQEAYRIVSEEMWKLLHRRRQKHNGGRVRACKERRRFADQHEETSFFQGVRNT